MKTEGGFIVNSHRTQDGGGLVFPSAGTNPRHGDSRNAGVSRYNRMVSKLPPPTAPTVGFISLGCPKNLVDSEVMMGLLDRAGARLTAHPEDADILVVNTCSFIDTAKQESVDTILEMARHKTSGRATKLIVAGCLVERYRDEIRKSIPEVDAVVGTGELESILEAAGIARPQAAALSPFNILTSSGAAEMRSGQESLPGTHQAETIAFRAEGDLDRKSTRLNSSHANISYAVFCLKKK